MNGREREFDLIDKASFALAVLTAAAAVLRIAFREVAERVDATTLSYFGVAGALLLLRRVKTLAFGDYKLELRDLEAKTDEALEEAKTAVSMAQHVAAPSPAAAPRAAEDAWDREPGDADDDPWKGVFGGQAEAGHRRLAAEVAAVRGEQGWYRIRLHVQSTDPRAHPLTGRVRFFIHDTFPDDRPFVRVVDGVAELRLRAWGAFTVGALADDGATALELDLAAVGSFPRQFRER
jgi:hypothetical protein